ncbi:MltA-interacting protein MipA [Klebsiella pneumoniae]|nr:MltA-interacting protein MipA [Klebsiella pneumoniae]SXN82907.1 MltA-interacting protein MipA [Klebsiella pneumoniae]
MTKIKLLALGVLIATSASAAHADGKFTLGAGVGVVEHPYKQYDADVYPVPVISYESDNFWFHGLGGGYYLWNDTNDKLSITAYWSPMYFKPGDSDSEQMRRLDKRKSTVMAGLSYVHNTPYGFLRTTIAGDTLDNSNGINWDLAWLYRYTNGNLTLTPGIGVEWNSDNQNEYYYGVSRHESRPAACAAMTRTVAGTRIWNCRLTIASLVTGAFTAWRATRVCRMKLPTVRWWINPGAV